MTPQSKPGGAGPSNAGSIPDPNEAPVAVVLDEEALVATAGGSRELAVELAEIFLSELDSRIDEFVAALADGSATRLQFAAHTLRGSAGSLSAYQVTASAATIEDMARRGDVSGARAIFERLRGELELLAGRLGALDKSA
jgi:HPt (histidine-containing phosphotransfer) domain-containing protein